LNIGKEIIELLRVMKNGVVVNVLSVDAENLSVQRRTAS
jgi:hypothetical protein